MDTQKTLIVVVLVGTILMGSFIVYDQYSKGRFSSHAGENWQWRDQWPNSQQYKPEVVKPEIKPEVKPEIKVDQISTTVYGEAIDLAKKKDMKVVLFFHANWCKWCKKMENESFSDDKVKQALKKYILASLDADQNENATSKYGVSGIPALIMIDGKGNVIKKANYMDASKFVSWLK
jgi:thiol:disulfide interchange protein